MNRKQLTLLIVLAVVIGGFGWYSYNKRKSGYVRGSEDAAGRKLLAGVPESAINDVAQITIRSATNQVNLARSADGWTVQERGGYPANFTSISDLLKKLWDLKVTRSIEGGASRLQRLKLTKEEGTVVDLKDDKGKSIVALTLGLQATRESGGDPQFGGGSFPSGRYVMRGDDTKTMALVGDPLTVEPKADEWINKDWFKVEKPKAVSVVSTNATNTWKLVRETEAGDWKLADAKPGENADSSKTSGMNYLLSSPSFNDVTVGTNALANPTTATIETFDGFTYTVKVAKADGENHAMQVGVSANLPKERTPGKDEKKEDKEKLDKEFADKQKQLQEKFKNEKAFEKWTYLVSNWTVENLLKSRSDFLAEKKEEPKPGENKDGAAPTPAPAPTPVPPTQVPPATGTK